MIKMLYLICFTALLTPLVACAQNPTVDYDWTFHIVGAKYGVAQTSWAGHDRYIYLYFGNTERHVHVPAPLPLIAALVLVPVVLFPVLLVRYARRKCISDVKDVA